VVTVGRGVVNNHDASTIVGVVNKLHRRNFKSRVWAKVSERSTLLKDTRISLQHSMGQMEGNLHSSNRFDTIPAFDGQTDGHTTTAYTTLA